MLSTLIQEHETILRVLKALQRFAEHHGKRAPEPRKIISYFVLFFRQYLDQWHHGKEESLLFPAMVDAGVPEQTGLLACMLREHAEGRHILEGLAALTAGTDDLTVREWTIFAELAKRYLQLMEHHISMENQGLFLMAEEVFSPEQMTALKESAAEIDARWGQDGPDLQELGETLASRYP